MGGVGWWGQGWECHVAQRDVLGQRAICLDVDLLLLCFGLHESIAVSVEAAVGRSPLGHRDRNKKLGSCS
jgi:hypothetical protein